MIKSCIYCGQLRKMTKEHVYGRWLRKTIGEWAKVITIVGTADEQPRTRHPEVPFDITVPVVCDPCNHEWMKDLEDGVAPILTPMIHGRARVLDLNEQRTIATWFAKTVQMMACQVKTTKLIPPDHYEMMFKARRPPLGASIWLAAQTEPIDAPVSAVYGDIDHHWVTASKDPRVLAGANFYSAGLTLGGLGLMILANIDGTEPSPLPAEAANAYVIPIWPATEERSWPPTSTDAIGGYKAFYESLFAV